MFTKNTVVLYKKDPAIITECGDKLTISYLVRVKNKYQLQTQKVREKDIAFLCDANGISNVQKDLETMLLYKENAENDDTQKAQIDKNLREAWELLQEESCTQYSLKDVWELTGEEFNTKNCFCVYNFLHTLPYFVETLENSKLFYTCRSLDEINALVAKQEEKAKGAQVREEFLSRLKSKKIDKNLDGKFMQEIEAFALGKTDKSKLLKEAGFAETEEAAHALLIETNFWPFWKNPYPARAGLSTQSASLHLENPPDEERVKLEHTAFAIDNIWSTDPDDAVAFDGTYLWVHIADPASTVAVDSAIDKSARNRGATLYLPEGASRMLEEEALEAYALGLKHESNALSFRLLLDETGAIKETTVLKTIVNVARLSYEEADLKQNDENLAPLFAIAERNIQRRRKAGAVFINLPEVHVNVDMQNCKNASDSAMPSIKIEPILHTKSANMVREMMLLAGEGAAKFAFKNDIPFPYISQESPDIPKELPTGLAGEYRLRRSMRSRSVGVTPQDHAGLGLGMYSQVTSPLRRYSDLAAHQQLRAFLAGQKLLDKDTLLKNISAGDSAASASIKVERKSRLHWTLCYLKMHPEWSADAVIVEIKDKIATVLIPSIGQEAQIAISKKYALNDVVRVKAKSIKIPKLTVQFCEMLD